MSQIIYKFNQDMLKGQTLHIGKNCHAQNYDKHWHSYYEILCYQNCIGHSELNGQTYPITESCLFLLTPKDFHSLQVKGLTGADSFVISFSAQMIDDSLFAEVTKGPVYIAQLPQWIAQLVNELHRAYKKRSAHREDLLYHLFNSLLIEILEHGSSLSHIAADIHPMIRDSISIMLSEPTQPYSLADFSARFNVSTTYFSRLFHENAGISFKQYQSFLRIEHAKRLLEEKNLPIIDVGGECGFNTPSQFIRAFKQLTGMTPSVYRDTFAGKNKSTV